MEDEEKQRELEYINHSKNAVNNMPSDINRDIIIENNDRINKSVLIDSNNPADLLGE